MTTKLDSALDALQTADRPPPDYDRPATYHALISETDVAVPMRDGVKLSVDIYRPDSPEKFPALLAFAIYNKDFQGPEMAETIPPQPAWSPLWTGPMETGDTRFFVSRGYVHVVGMPRGVGKSEGGGARNFDSYDLIEWIAAQPWCDGNVGMVGISGFGAEQLHVASNSPLTSRRSSRSIRAAPMGCLAASARNIRAASSICFAISSVTSPPCIRRRASPARSRPSAMRSGAPR